MLSNYSFSPVSLFFLLQGFLSQEFRKVEEILHI